MILLKDALAQTRRERGLTQEELAARLYITRQAVSRWETGATEPGIDMIKLIARELDVPVTRLLDMPEHYCQSCGMMFTEPDQRGHEADGTETDEFCRWCYDKGTYTHETTMEEMIEDCAPRMAQNMDWSVDECASLLGAILPTLRLFASMPATVLFTPIFPARTRFILTPHCSLASRFILDALPLASERKLRSSR